MPVLAREMTPVRAPRRKLVHVTSLATPRFTACGKRCDGWTVALAMVSCQDCQDAIRVSRRSL